MLLNNHDRALSSSGGGRGKDRTLPNIKIVVDKEVQDHYWDLPTFHQASTPAQNLSKQSLASNLSIDSLTDVPPPPSIINNNSLITTISSKK